MFVTKSVRVRIQKTDLRFAVLQKISVTVSSILTRVPYEVHVVVLGGYYRT